MAQSSDSSSKEKQVPAVEPPNELAALKKRMVDGAVGNFLCAGWHVYLGISILTTWRGDQAAFGNVFLGFAAVQVIAGAWMLLRPSAGLFIVDAGIYFFCALMNGVAGEVGGVAWIKYLGYFQAFLGLDACRRYRLFKHAGKRAESAPLIVESAPAAEAAPAAAPSAAPAAAPAPAGVALAGSWQGGNFVLTKEQLGAVLANPDAFDNVLVGTEQRASGATEVWLLVLGNDAGIVLNKSGEHILRFTPDGVTCSRGIAVIRTADGTKVKCSLTDIVALWAWRCRSEDEFLKGADRFLRPTQWDLLCWSLTQERRPEAWLGWRPSYGSREDGLRALCRDGVALDKMIKKHRVGVAAKWVPRAEPAEAGVLRSAILAIALRQAKLGKLLSGPLVAAGLALMVPVILRAREHEIISSFTACGALVFGAVLILFGIGVLIFGLHRSHVARKLSREG